MELRQSTSQIIRFGPFLDSTDGVTPEPSLTITQADMQISKDGATFAQKNTAGNATHDVDGYYTTTFNTTDSDTTAILKLQVNVAGALPVWENFDVVTQSYYDAKYSGTFNNLGGVAQSADNDTKISALSTVVPPSVAQFNARTLLAANYFDFTSDAVQVGTNNDKTGYSISGTLNILDDLQDLKQSDVVTSGAIQTSSGIVINVGQVGQLLAIADDAITASSIAAGAFDDKGNWNIGKTGYELTVTPPTAVQNRQEMDANSVDLNSILTNQTTINDNVVQNGTDIGNLNNITADEVLAAGDIDGFSLEDALKLVLSSAVGVLAGAATNSITIQAADGSKTRLTATVDADGNRSAVIKDVTG